MQTTQMSTDAAVRTGERKLKTSVTLRPELVSLVDKCAEREERNRSYMINKLIETHPEIVKLKKERASRNGE